MDTNQRIDLLDLLAEIDEKRTAWMQERNTRKFRKKERRARVREVNHLIDKYNKTVKFKALPLIH